MKALIAGLGLLLLFSCSVEDKHIRVANAGVKKTVKIVSTYSKDGQKRGRISGSGVFISPRGHILTCAHLFPKMKGHKRITRVYLKDKTQLRNVVILRIDRRKDLALMKADFRSYHYATIAPKNSVKLGQHVIAVGHPWGEEWSVTAGIISHLNRIVFEYKAVQIDAAVNPGNSGGPLFNMRGELIGINSAGCAPWGIPMQVGINYAVSLDEIWEMLMLFYGVLPCGQL